MPSSLHLLTQTNTLPSIAGFAHSYDDDDSRVCHVCHDDDDDDDDDDDGE